MPPLFYQPQFSPSVQWVPINFHLGPSASPACTLEFKTALHDWLPWSVPSTVVRASVSPSGQWVLRRSSELLLGPLWPCFFSGSLEVSAEDPCTPLFHCPSNGSAWGPCSLSLPGRAVGPRAPAPPDLWPLPPRRMSSTLSSRRCCLTSAPSPTPGSTCRRGSASTSRSMRNGCRRMRSGR